MKISLRTSGYTQVPVGQEITQNQLCYTHSTSTTSKMTQVEFNEETSMESETAASHSNSMQQSAYSRLHRTISSNKWLIITLVAVFLIALFINIFLLLHYSEENKIIPYKDLPPSIQNKFPPSVKALYENPHVQE